MFDIDIYMKETKKDKQQFVEQFNSFVKQNSERERLFKKLFNSLTNKEIKCINLIYEEFSYNLPLATKNIINYIMLPRKKCNGRNDYIMNKTNNIKIKYKTTVFIILLLSASISTFLNVYLLVFMSIFNVLMLLQFRKNSFIEQYYFEEYIEDFVNDNEISHLLTPAEIIQIQDNEDIIISKHKNYELYFEIQNKYNYIEEYKNYQKQKKLENKLKNKENLFDNDL